jgi:hypothetical protein
VVGLLAAVHPAVALRRRECSESAEQEGRNDPLEHAIVQRFSCPLVHKLR